MENNQNNQNDQSDQTDIQRQITATILKLRQRSPFFATLALFARMVVSETITRTAATDGRDIYINPVFWAGMNREERLGVFTHEVLHAALLHVPRCGKTRDPLLWNVAADIVVNGMLVANKFELPAGHIRDEKLEHLSVEEIYHILLPLAQKYIMLDGGDLIYNGANGDLDAREHQALETYWRMAVQQGQILAQAQGNQPAGMLRELEHLNPAQLDWRSYLWRFWCELLQTSRTLIDALSAKVCIWIISQASRYVSISALILAGLWVVKRCAFFSVRLWVFLVLIRTSRRNFIMLMLPVMVPTNWPEPMNYPGRLVEVVPAFSLSLRQSSRRMMGSMGQVSAFT